MDYEGQKLAELIFYIIILTFGCVGWVIGYFQEDFTVVFQAWLAGVVLSVILCVPDWPFYNRHPIKWLESVPDRRQHAKSS
ncbi:signal peptidase complex subunit 1 [Fistulifera solaris]|uniref:Signal peptidase complex subunit 1 n=1 Tax=Fistulifera solaris TaxID=1519565 RepID=A0A1Z5KAX5_FISSO|nr:signal peptidase complex subunit 1 [Fistulifera solaris]|eukprot:GAX23251.1 signal peptidase complex subunit 1 [Fistulifera solaris]